LQTRLHIPLFTLPLCLFFFIAACGRSQTNTGDQQNSKNKNLTAHFVSPGCPEVIGGNRSSLPSETTISRDHRVTTSSGMLPYTVTSGYLPLYAEGAEDGPIRACLFFFAYTRDDKKNNTNWPTTFLFNGGPGAASDWIHLGGMGPLKINFGAEGFTPLSNSLADDPYTLLANSDLIFIDPIGSGYSRVASGVNPVEFDGLHQDANSIGDFISNYRTKFSRTQSPLYLIGESYSGMRLPVLGRYLDEKLGIKTTGIVFISPWMDTLDDDVFRDDNAANDLPYVSYLPEMAAVAWYHQKLDPELLAGDLDTIYSDAEKFANTDYLEALTVGNELVSSEFHRISDLMRHYTGLSTELIEKDNLRVPLSQFVAGLLKDQGETISYYDGRMKAIESDVAKSDPYDAFDPLFDSVDQHYFKNVLGIQTSLEYSGNDWSAWPGANPKNNIRGGYLNVLDDINVLMTNNPDLKVMMANGLFDLVCPPAEVHAQVRHLNPAVAKRIELTHYRAGHPIYFGDTAHAQLSADLDRFFGRKPNRPLSNTF